MSLPSARPTSIKQPLTGLPSTSTVHAPHIPTPHPSRTPNNFNSRRNTSSSVWWVRALTRCWRPLTRSVRVILPSSSVGRSSIVELSYTAQNLLWSDRQILNPRAGRAKHRVPDRRHHRRQRGLADTVDVVGLEMLQHRQRDLRQIVETADHVVAQVAILELALVVDHLLEQRVSNTESNAAFGLQLGLY